eukprot:6745280-Prymnesium_polylepis.2
MSAPSPAMPRTSQSERQRNESNRRRPWSRLPSRWNEARRIQETATRAVWADGVRARRGGLAGSASNVPLPCASSCASASARARTPQRIPIGRGGARQQIDHSHRGRRSAQPNRVDQRLAS